MLLGKEIYYKGKMIRLGKWPLHAGALFLLN